MKHGRISLLALFSILVLACVPAADGKTEWAFARLRYPSIGMGWRGGRHSSWGTDCPKPTARLNPRLTGPGS